MNYCEQLVSFFADDGEYITYDNRHCRDKAEVRATFVARDAGGTGPMATPQPLG